MWLPLGLIVFACVALGQGRKDPRARWRAATATALYVALALLPYALIHLAVGPEMFRVYTGKPVPFFSFEGYARLSDFAGRFVFKNIFLWGVFGSLVLAGGGAAWLTRALRRGASSRPPVGAGVPASVLWAVWAGLGYSLVLFFRLPLEVSYLLPVLFLGVFLLNFAPRAPLFLALLLAAQVSYGLVSLELLQVRYSRSGFNGRAAEGARFSLHFDAGVVAKDLALRAEAEAFYIRKFGLKDLPSRHAGLWNDSL